MEKEKCDCGEDAQWLYMPGYICGGNSYSCDDCVGRGCSCNNYGLVEFPNEKEGYKEGEYKIVDNCLVPTDSKGREYPCCEYSYEEKGFEKD